MKDSIQAEILSVLWLIATLLAYSNGLVFLSWVTAILSAISFCTSIYLGYKGK